GAGGPRGGDGQVRIVEVPGTIGHRRCDLGGHRSAAFEQLGVDPQHTGLGGEGVAGRSPATTSEAPGTSTSLATTAPAVSDSAVASIQPRSRARSMTWAGSTFTTTLPSPALAAQGLTTQTQTVLEVDQPGPHGEHHGQQHQGEPDPAGRLPPQLEGQEAEGDGDGL